MRAVVLGAGGFIGSHMTRHLKEHGVFVRAVDLRKPAFEPSAADEFLIGDLTDSSVAALALDSSFDEAYQFAADMGGAGYIFSGKNDSSIVRNSAMINLNVAEACRMNRINKLFFSSSACIYPSQNQCDPSAPVCSEETAYPANPDSEYGWEKLFSERLFLSYKRNHDIDVRIARLHNVFGPSGTWKGGREKVPAAICRKVAEAAEGGFIEIWGDGNQTRSFLQIQDCVEGIYRLMNSDFGGPVNLGSEEMISINELARLVIEISGKKLGILNVDGPLGVRGRTSDNRLLRKRLGWAPSKPLRDGLVNLYQWIATQVKQDNSLKG